MNAAHPAMRHRSAISGDESAVIATTGMCDNSG
jgi:hypothetical protein